LGGDENGETGKTSRTDFGPPRQPTQNSGPKGGEEERRTVVARKGHEEDSPTLVKKGLKATPLVKGGVGVKNVTTHAKKTTAFPGPREGEAEKGKSGGKGWSGFKFARTRGKP